MAPNSPNSERIPLVVEILRRRNFRNLWLSNIFADVSTHTRTIGVAWLALDLSDSQLWVGLSLGTIAIPIVILSLLSGAIVDRLARRQIIILSQLTAVGFLLLTVLLIASDRLVIWHLPIMTLGAGAVLAFLRPARAVYVLESVKENQILTANSLTAVSNNAAEMLAPVITGFLIAQYGAESPFLFAGIVSILAIGLILRTHSKSPSSALDAEGSLKKQIAEGVTYAVTNKLILALLVVSATAVFGTAVIPLLPVYGRDVLGAGPSGYGVLAASLASGYLVGSLLMAVLGDLQHKGLWLLVTASIWDIGAVVFGFSRVFPLSATVLIIMGVGGSMFMTLLTTLIQQLTPHEMRGRVLSLYNIAFSAMPIGFMVGGALAQAINNEFALIFGAIMGTPIIAILFLRIPALRSL